MGRKIAGGIKNGFDYVKNSKAGKFLYDTNVEGKALRETLGLNTADYARKINDAADCGESKENEKGKKHTVRNTTVCSGLASLGASLGGVAIEKVTEGISRDLGSREGYVKIGFGSPLVCKIVEGAVTQHSEPTTTYMLGEQIANGIIWSSVIGGLELLLLGGNYIYQSRQLKKAMKKTEG